MNSMDSILNMIHTEALESAPPENRWKCACGWKGVPSQMTVSNTLRTCPDCGASGGLILDEPNSTPTEEAREIATRWAGENTVAFGANKGKLLVDAIASALKASELAGYNRGVEESAKVADVCSCGSGPGFRPVDMRHHTLNCAKHVATMIRATLVK